MFREQHNFDAWLTNQPDGYPVFHSCEEADRASYNSVNDKNYVSVFTLSFDNFDELRCNNCHRSIGFLLHDDVVPPSSSYVEFWQIDQDGEHLLCDNCYEETTKEIE